MTNHWIDLKNADAFLIMGSNAAEHHPISFKWVLRAKDKGAVVIHVDPKFSRTSARSNFHVPLRSGTDIAFLGGMIKYIIENEKYFKDYVVEYTNAAFIVNKDFAFQDGLFSGFDATARKYDTKTWSFDMDEAGVPKKDKSLQDPRCVFQLLKQHYSRYSLDKVSSITGVSKENLLKVYEAYSATGTGTKAGTVMYALGWTQHTVGVQNIRSACMIQLLLGNMGIPGGGVNALRGEPNVQGSTDHALLYHILPGYIGVPIDDWQTLADYNKANTPVTKDPKSANWWQNKPKYLASLLKGWYGEKATQENDFCYGLIPKAEKGVDYSYVPASRIIRSFCEPISNSDDVSPPNSSKEPPVHGRLPRIPPIKSRILISPLAPILHPMKKEDCYIIVHSGEYNVSPLGLQAIARKLLSPL